MELFTPDFGLVFWMFIAFILLFLVLAKWGWRGRREASQRAA